VIGLYVPGSSALHRTPAGGKLGLLAALLLAVGAWRTFTTVGATAALALAGTAASGVGWTAMARQLRPVLAFVVMVVALQLWWADWRLAVLSGAWLLTAVALAALVTLTTPMDELTDTLVRALGPLRRVGVDPERAGLVLALAVRAVPVMAELAGQVRDARRARGAERSMRAFAVPMVVRSVRYGHRLGEALTARGVDDEWEDDAPQDAAAPGR
jgi:biotin transport system permease protein